MKAHTKINTSQNLTGYDKGDALINILFILDQNNAGMRKTDC